MYLYLDQILRELRKDFSVQSFNISPHTVISNIELLPERISLKNPALCQDTVYVCDYRQLLKYDPNIDLAPLICVVEPGTDANEVFFRGRCVVAVTCSSVTSVLSSLSKRLYDCGCRSSDLSELSRSLLKCQNLQELLSEGYKLLGNPVVVADSTQHILAYTSPSDVQNPLYPQILAVQYLPIGHPDVKNTAENWELPVGSSVPLIDEGFEELPSVYRKLLVVGSRIVGSIHVLQLERPFSEADSSIVEILGNLVAIELHKQPEIHSPDNTWRTEQLLRLILDNALLDTAFIRQQQKAIGLKLGPVLYALVFHVRRKELTPRLSLRDIAQSISAELPNSHGLFFRNSIFLLLSTENEIRDFDAELEPILPFLRKHDMIVGVSNSFSDIVDIRKYGFQAQKAMQLGIRLHKDKKIYLFSDYAIYYMIELSLKTGELDTLCSPALMRLIRYCETNGKELLNTLCVYLRCGCSRSRTAREMYLHLNTVKYRMSKIEEILGLDLGSSENALKLMLSFKLLEYSESFPDFEPLAI